MQDGEDGGGWRNDKVSEKASPPNRAWNEIAFSILLRTRDYTTVVSQPASQSVSSGGVALGVRVDTTKIMGENGTGRSELLIYKFKKSQSTNAYVFKKSMMMV